MSAPTELLKDVPLFGSLNRDQLQTLSRSFRERTFPAGSEVLTEGQSGVGFFVIEDGEASVSVGGKIVRTLGPGEHFGEVALIDSGPRSATIIANTDLRCRGMSAWEFRPFVEEHPEVAWSLLETLVGRLREAQEPR